MWLLMAWKSRIRWFVISATLAVVLLGVSANEPLRVCRQLYSIVGFVTKIGAGCKHGVENCEELAGGGGYGCFDGFSGTLQAIAKGLEGIAPSGSV